jgi:hypothetical protein
MWRRRRRGNDLINQEPPINISSVTSANDEYIIDQIYLVIS